jgi:hypothetical protein
VWTRGLVALALVALGSSARADDKRLGIVVQGETRLRLKLQTYLAKTLQRDGFAIDDAPIGRKGIETLANCFIIEDLACVRGVVEARATTPQLIHARIEETSDGVTIDLTWFSSGNAPITERAACESCEAGWKEIVDDPVRRLEATAPKPTVTATEPGPERARQRSRFWPAVLVTLGSATLVAGGVFVYYGVRDGASHKYVYPQLTPVGIAMMAVGGGAAIGGVFLLKPSGTNRAGPVAAASKHGAYLGWAAEF